MVPSQWTMLEDSSGKVSRQPNWSKLVCVTCTPQFTDAHTVAGKGIKKPGL